MRGRVQEGKNFWGEEYKRDREGVLPEEQQPSNEDGKTFLMIKTMKKLSYQEVAETMSGLVKDVNVISEKVSGILNRVNELQEPGNVKEQACLNC